ncbi:MAG: CHASE2 domain-containing protein [Alphaproteobacteria bacterium]|jgi:adenylate cyclase|nr:CHASE2 domain-containing protein [Alphaproteobacteria bacterium]
MTDSKSISNRQPAGHGLGPDIHRKVRYWGAGGLLLFIALAGGLDFERLRNDIFDLYQRWSPRQVETLPARLVEIDEASLREIGAWPWPRTVLAALAKAAVDRGAVAVGFDMIFPEPDRHAPQSFAARHPEIPDAIAREIFGLADPDAIFATAIGRLPIVLSRSGTAVGSDAADLPIEAVFTGGKVTGLLSFKSAISNIPELDEVALGQASINGPPDSDGVIRRVPLVVEIAGRPTPSLSLELLRVASGVDEISLLAPDGILRAVRLADQTIPVDPDGRMRLHFSRALESRTVSAADVLAGRVGKDVFKSSVVIISAAALGLEDVVATPLVSESFGADVHAQAIENILSEAWLKRPSWAPRAEWGVAIMLALMAIAAIPFASPQQSTGVVLVVGGGIVALSYGLFAQGSYLIDPAVPVAGGGLTSLFALVGQLVETEKARARLRDALVEERITSAKLAGELEAAREIQLGMLPDQATLDALPEAVELRAYLEPAKAVGGDLYDAFMIDERWLYFIVGDVTGKGVPASLFMALAKALSKSVILRYGEDLEEAVMAANEEISRENSAELFVTALIGLLDIETGEVRLCNAGHDNPLILRGDGSIEEFEMEGGPPLCVFEGFPYPLETCHLMPGETMVVLTDGVTEAKSPADELFGHTRVLDVLRQRPESERQVVDGLVAAVHAFEVDGEATDDLTIMVLTYRG